jgi:hypothetical protein
MRNRGHKKGLGPGGEVRYMSGMLDMETIKRFSTELAKAKFDAENVVRVESEPTANFHGEEALDIRIFVKRGVVERFTGEEVLDTLVQISARLRQSGDERFPIIWYATAYGPKRKSVTRLRG